LIQAINFFELLAFSRQREKLDFAVSFAPQALQVVRLRTTSEPPHPIIYCEHMLTKNKIKFLADEYADRLKLAIESRVAEMNEDNVSHYLIYRVLGVAREERSIDRCLSE
jgi:hypothetical protein